MAVLIPALISIGTGAFGAAAGAIAAGTAGFAAFATVAGTVLTGLGALTGSKDMQKIGGILSLGAGLSNAFAGAAGGASAGAVDSAALGLDGAADAAANGFASGAEGIATGAAGTFDAAAAAKDFGGQINTGFEAGASAAQPGMVNQGLAQAANEAPVSPLWAKAQGMGGADSQLASQQLGITGQQAAAGATAPGAVDLGSMGGGATGALARGAAETTQSDISAYLAKAWERAQIGLSGIGKFAKDNKELVQMGGMALQSAYGPEAEKLDYQKSLMERARRNLNAPVKLNFGG